MAGDKAKGKAIEAAAPIDRRRLVLPFTRGFGEWLEQQPNSKKNFLLAILTGVALALPSTAKAIWSYMTAPLPRVTMPCQAAAFPLRSKYGDKPVYGFELSPSWGSQ